jgi:hypothetical protein
MRVTGVMTFSAAIIVLLRPGAVKLRLCSWIAPIG